MDRYPPEPYSHAVKESYVGITKPETLLVWVSFSRPGFEISEKQAELVLNYMECHEYTLSVSGMKMARTDITDGKTIPYSLDDVIGTVYEWNYKIGHGLADGMANPENDCLLLGRLFAQTVYGKECYVLAAGIMAGTARIFGKGNCILAGHNGSSRGIYFTNLGNIKTGAEVKLTNKKKKTHIYKVIETKTVYPYDDNYVAGQTEDETLTLFTCAENGSKRFVVKCIRLK